MDVLHPLGSVLLTGPTPEGYWGGLRDSTILGQVFVLLPPYPAGPCYTVVAKLVLGPVQ